MQSPAYCVFVVRLYKWSIQVAGLTEIARSTGLNVDPDPLRNDSGTHTYTRTHTHTHASFACLTLRERYVRPLRVPLGLMTQLVLRYDERRSMRRVFFTRRNRESMRWINACLLNYKSILDYSFNDNRLEIWHMLSNPFNLVIYYIKKNKKKLERINIICTLTMAPKYFNKKR